MTHRHDQQPASNAGTVTLREGDASWHDGPGWYYTIDDYPDEGSCGAFASRVLAEQHAEIAGHTVSEACESAAVTVEIADAAVSGGIEMIGGEA